MGRSDYELQPAPEFLFHRRPVRRGREVGGEARNAVRLTGNEPPYRARRHEERVIRRDDAPTLTITSDPYNSVVVTGNNKPDWSVFFWAEAGGETEAEADQRLSRSSFGVAGNLVSLRGPSLHERSDTRSELLVEGPNDAGLVIHGSYAAVEVSDMSGPVRIAATHARARVLDTTGQVDVTAGCVDFAGSCGRVTLSAEAEINLKITAPEFDGTLLAWGQRSVRMLVPSEFSTPLEAIVGSRDGFVCRAKIQSKIREKRQGEIYVFTYGIRADDGFRTALHLRSDASTVVIDELES
jgi:hypothetical protein